jgi:hypothetical protein
MRSCARFTPSPQQWTISARRQHIVNLCSERALIVVCAACYKKGGHLIPSSLGVLGRLQS